MNPIVEAGQKGRCSEIEAVIKRKEKVGESKVQLHHRNSFQTNKLGSFISVSLSLHTRVQEPAGTSVGLTRQIRCDAKRLY